MLSKLIYNSIYINQMLDVIYISWAIFKKGTRKLKQKWLIWVKIL